MQEEETEIAWTAVTEHEAVVASDGQKVGTVVDVAALPEEDIFHGIVFAHSALGKHLVVPADDIEKITDRAIYLSIDSQAAQRGQEFHELHVEKLGLHGLFRWKHMGWKRSGE